MCSVLMMMKSKVMFVSLFCWCKKKRSNPWYKIMIQLWVLWITAPWLTFIYLEETPLWSLLFYSNTLHHCCTFHTFTPGSRPVQLHRAAKRYKTTCTLCTYTLLGGHSHRWSLRLQYHSHEGRHTPFLAGDLRCGGLLRPLERRGQEIQLAYLCESPTYKESKCCLKSSRHI